MSHFSVLVVGTDIDGQLAPFDENLEVEPYKVTLSEEDQNRMLEFYRREKNKPDMTKEEVCEYWDSWDWWIEWWVDEDWNIYKMSTYNPDSKWDWCEIGWRWAWKLIVKPECKDLYRAPNFSWWWSDEEKKELLDWLHTDSCLKRDLDIEATKAAWFDYVFAILIDWHWYERWQMWWFAFVSNENPDWDKVQAEIWNQIPDDEFITVVDCHI